MSRSQTSVHQSKANFFADLKLPDADNYFLKAQIVAELYRLTGARRLTLANAGALMGISQPEVSKLFKGQFSEYSIERLMTFLTAFDLDVDIITKPRKHSGERGRMTFKLASA